MEYRIYKNSEKAENVETQAAYDIHLTAYNKITKLLDGRTDDEFISELEISIYEQLSENELFKIYPDKMKTEMVRNRVWENNDYQLVMYTTPHYFYKPELVIIDYTTYREYKDLSSLYSALKNVAATYKLDTSGMGRYVFDILNQVRIEQYYDSSKDNAYKLNVDKFIQIKKK